MPYYIRTPLNDIKGDLTIGVMYRTAVVHGYSLIVHKHHRAISDIGRMWRNMTHAWHPDLPTMAYQYRFQCNGFQAVGDRTSFRLSDKIYAAVTDLLVENLRMTTSDAMNACIAMSVSTSDHVDENIEVCVQFASGFENLVTQRREFFYIIERGLEVVRTEKDAAERQVKMDRMGPDPQTRWFGGDDAN